MENNNDAIIKDSDSLHKKIISTPLPSNIHNKTTNDDLVSMLITSGTASHIDIGKITAFTQSAQNRDTMYRLIDTMADDPIIAAVLETYAEDATEYNPEGNIVWVESDESEVAKFITYLLNTLEVDKNIYKWVYSLCKYGDVYLQLFKKSEYDVDPIFSQLDNPKGVLNEELYMNTYKESDKFVHYIEMVANPAELFELTRLGKTSGFIKADVSTNVRKNEDKLLNLSFQYHFKKSDVNVYNSDKFAHAMLEDNVTRMPEEVTLLMDREKDKDVSYRVRRGQSLLQNVFKIWRELSLLENSILLNRVTKSAIVRMINVEVGDMSKEMVGPHLQGVKSLFEQKAALDVGNNMQEYTNPGPIENNIYVPTYNGKGAITTDQVGGDVNISQMPDIEYFQNKYFGALRVPKQYFGLTDDAAGFSGGQSLAIISSRYAKMVKRIQSSICQAITDAINILLMDKGLNSYINKFNIKMMPPTTQEDIERRENTASRVQLTADIMNLVSDIEDAPTKMKILKSLISNVISDNDVIALLENEIERLETEATETDKDVPEDLLSGGDSDDLGLGSESSSREPLNLDVNLDIDTVEPTEGDATEELPSPEELGQDFTDNNAEF